MVVTHLALGVLQGTVEFSAMNFEGSSVAFVVALLGSGSMLVLTLFLGDWDATSL